MPSSGLIPRLAPRIEDAGSEVMPVGSLNRYCLQLPQSPSGGYGNTAVAAGSTSYALIPFRLRRPIAVDAVTIDCATAAAGSTLTVAIYSVDPVSGRGRCVYLAPIDTTSTGERTTQTPGVLPAGLLGFAWQASGGSPTVRATSSVLADVANAWHVGGGGFGPAKNWETALGSTIDGQIGRPFQRVDIGNQFGQAPVPSAWFRIKS
jgi:hypothetical protein